MDEKNEIIEVEPVPAQIEGLDEAEARAYQQLLARFLRSYKEKGEEVTDCQWLEEEFLRELPELPEEKAAEMAAEIVESTEKFDEDYASVNRACASGVSKEQWLADQLAESAAGMSVADYGNYLSGMHTAMEHANAQMLRTVTTGSGEISQAWNLDGFIAEQQNVNQFNLRAALNKSPYVAEVCTPAAGETYGKNSFDCVIRDKNSGSIVHQYQLKYGKDAEATAALIRSGNYNNQRLLVPPEQVEELRQMFPGKSIDAVLGGTDKVPISSDALSKAEVKSLQEQIQQGGEIPASRWNSFNTKELALSLGKNAAITGMQAAAVSVGFSLAQKALKGEMIDKDELVDTALRTGADVGVKNVTAGALTVWAGRSSISALANAAPGTLAKIAAVSVENVKILAKVAKGELSLTQGMDAMGRTGSAMVCGLSCVAKGSAIGAAALSWIPVVGPVVGGIIGGSIGYFAGSSFGQAVYKGLKTVGSAVTKVVKSAFNAVRNIGRKLFSFFFG